MFLCAFQIHPRELSVLIALGNWFHQVGPNTLKDLAANALFLTLGIINFLYSPEDLRPSLLMGFRVSRFDKYAKASTHQVTCTKITTIN